MVCVEQRERQYTFFLFIVMFNNTINQNQMNNSNPIVTLSHETGIILSKQSSESEIKRYFNKVLELSKSDNEFPINLDEMWMLVYGRKSDVDAGYFEMTEKFIERNEHPGFVVTKVICTQKGLAYINTLFGGNKSDGKLARIFPRDSPPS